MDVFFTREHEWIRIEGGNGTVGITGYAVEQLGDITFVEMPDDDAEVRVDDESANIESVKAASPVYAPVSGRIVEVNSDLEETPETINQDPYGAGWIFKLEMTDADELDALMDGDAYEAFLEKEASEE